MLSVTQLVNDRTSIWIQGYLTEKSLWLESFLLLLYQEQNLFSYISAAHLTALQFFES